MIEETYSPYDDYAGFLLAKLVEMSPYEMNADVSVLKSKLSDTHVWTVRITCGEDTMEQRGPSLLQAVLKLLGYAETKGWLSPEGE